MGERADGGEGGRNQPGEGPISLQRGFVPGWLPPSPPSQVLKMSRSRRHIRGIIPQDVIHNAETFVLTPRT